MTKDEKKELIKLAEKAVHDDADAFKLAVKLEFDIQQDTDNVQVWYWFDQSMKDAEVLTVDVGDDRLAATRLAVSMAAAEIGKNR